MRFNARFGTPAAAARELITRLDATEDAGQSFAIETTLASRTYAARVQRWSALGFLTVLHFIELPSADFALARVRARVAAGGHDIPEDDVRRRFDRGKRLFVELYKNAFDASYHWFSDEAGLRLLSKHAKPGR
jgi:predicted ABC-type ATPase